MNDVKELGTILGVWAHPDDETYLSAAVMCAAARTGQRVRCITATRGEKGSFDEERWPSATMGAVRQAELERCMVHLGVTDHQWLDYIDAECADVDPREAIGKVARHIADTKPDTILTFGPDGMTGHADHKAVSMWTTEAFWRAAKPGAQLYYATHTPEWAERWVPVFQKFNVFEEGPPITPVGELAIHYVCDDEMRDVKLRAINEHTSQIEGMMEAFGPDVFREAMSQENFRLAATA